MKLQSNASLKTCVFNSYLNLSKRFISFMHFGNRFQSTGPQRVFGLAPQRINPVTTSCVVHILTIVLSQWKLNVTGAKEKEYHNVLCIQSDMNFTYERVLGRGDRGRLAPGASWHPPCFIMFQVSEGAL